MRHAKLSRAAAAAALSCVCASAQALVTYVDEFRIVRSGAAYFLDEFADGVPPPNIPSAFNCGATAPACYTVNGTFLPDDEAGGKLRMDTARGSDTESAIGTPRVIQSARLITNRSDLPADVNAGLKQHRTFSASVVFDLVPLAPGDLMDVRFVDTHANAADPGHRTDFLALAVRRATTPGAVTQIRFYEQDFSVGTLTQIEVAPLNTTLGADQIRLTLNHAVANSTEVFASWEYLAAGAMVANGSFGTPGNIFDGETWTRADFTVSAAIPEAQTYAMMLLGLGLIGWRLRRR